MGATSIEWTDHSINPLRARHTATGRVGHYCEKISPGCAHCYSSRLQVRFGTPEFVAGQKRGEFECFLDESKLADVLRRKKPTKFFWCDMTDLFGEWVDINWIDSCFNAMFATQQHTHQVLTKRPDRMADYCCKRWGTFDGKTYPMAGNIWLGTSVEDQKRADERIPHLLRCPAAVRFLSCEPLLGPVHLRKHLLCADCITDLGETYDRVPEPCDGKCPRLDWCIVGGESGPGARPADVAWIRSIIGQCKAAGVACFVKQLGSHPIEGGNFHAKTGPVCGIRLRDKKGGDWDEWSDDLRVRQFPETTTCES